MKKVLLNYPAFWITAACFAIFNIAISLIPIEYAAGADIFYTLHHKKLAEAPLPEFDYIIIGDSRSMSLMGHAPVAKEPYSIYNFSLPALGSRYFKFFLQKYFSSKKRLPAAIIFAADSSHFNVRRTLPYHDPQMLYSDSTEDGLSAYLINRFNRRINYAVHGFPENTSSKKVRSELIWEAFSHRYLYFFDIEEMTEQFTGAERVFVLHESIPLLFNLYKFREAIKHHTIGFKTDYLKKTQALPNECNTCSGLLKQECHPDISRIEDNKKIKDGLRARYGQLNISDRLKPAQKMQILMLKDQVIDKEITNLSDDTVDLSELEKLIQYVTIQNKIKMIILNMPVVEDYLNTNFKKKYRMKLDELTKKYPLTVVIEYPRRGYPRDYFVEHVHYDCKGSDELNKDFYNQVVPKILTFAPFEKSTERNKTRGFEAVE